MNKLLFNKYSNKSLCLWTCFLLIVVFCFVVISLCFKFQFYISYTGIVSLEGGDYYVYILVSDSEISEINDKKLVIYGNQIDYQLYRIDDDYLITDHGPKRVLYLKFNLEQSQKVVNNVVKLNFCYESTLFNRLKEKM